MHTRTHTHTRVPPGIGNTVLLLNNFKYIIHNTINTYNTGGWILYYLGYSYSRSRRLLLLSAITISYQCPHVRVGLCAMWYIYVC
jgi:hypothetical protein